MPRSTLARHRSARFLRTSAEGGGGTNGQQQGQSDSGSGGENQQTGDGQQQQGQQQQNQQPVEATDEHGVGLGFPKDTAVDKMTDAQKASYWRNQSKIQQKRADELARQQQQGDGRQQNGDQQQQGNQSSREQIEAEIRAEVSKDATVALLRSSLHTRGKNAEEIDDLLQFVTADAFLTDEKKIDNQKVSTYLDRVAPSGSGGGGGGLPGQGNRNQQAEDKAAAGKAEAERRKFKPASGASSLIPSS